MAKIKRLKLPNDTSAREVYDVGAVRFDENGSLTEAQKAIARANVGVEEYTADEIENIWNSTT